MSHSLSATSEENRKSATTYAQTQGASSAKAGWRTRMPLSDGLRGELVSFGRGHCCVWDLLRGGRRNLLLKAIAREGLDARTGAPAAESYESHRHEHERPWRVRPAGVARWDAPLLGRQPRGPSRLPVPSGCWPLGGNPCLDAESPLLPFLGGCTHHASHGDNRGDQTILTRDSLCGHHQ